MTALTYNFVLFVSALLFDACFCKIDSSSPIVEIPLGLTDIDGDIEHRMDYWREDVGLSSSHWHWHIIHPFTGPHYIVNKDRNGELFYYFHQQLLARFNIERHNNGVNFVKPFGSMSAPITTAYNPMLTSEVAGKKWASRSKNEILRSVNRPDPSDGGTKVDIEDMKLYKKRILEAIDRKRIIDVNGTEISIDNDQGIDILGIIVQSVTDASPNLDYYGNLHNKGHATVAFVHDPLNQRKQPAGVMSAMETAVRDPFFFNWHAFINDIFNKHKNTLEPYDEEALSFPAVEVTNVELCSSHHKGKCGKDKNKLFTHMMKSDINMSRGVDFFPRKPLLVRLTHLNHDDFYYSIKYINRSPKQMLGTVRIFLLPVTQLDNDTMKLSEQRLWNIEMDRFVQPLKPGVNKIVRKSTMSSLTIPFEQVYRDLDTNRPKNDEYDKLEKFSYCGCGWPDYLLVPRGTAEGYPMLLFAMITDYRDDRTSVEENEPENHCKTSILCGLKYGKNYPYKLSSGFPFDRPIRADTIEDFLTPNMAIKPITIFHSDIIRRGQVLSKVAPTVLRKKLTRE